ncbi:MAG: helix-turn-helix domain-containing protein, partial [Alphaproteobacteria bacterium]
MKLAEYLTNQGISASDFAEKVGVAEASMSRYLSGKRLPRARVMRRIVEATGGAVEPNDFFAAGALAAPVTDDGFRAFLAAHPEVRAVDAVVPDMCGMMRGKRLEVGALAKVFAGAFRLPGSTYALDVTGQNVDATGLGLVDGDPDYACRPVAGTLVPVPWAERPAAQVLLSMYDDDMSPYPLDPRHVLARGAGRLEELGLKPVAALELEFYLVDAAKAAAAEPEPAVAPLGATRPSATQVYGMGDLDAFAPVIGEIMEACRVQGIPADVATAEYAPGQFEINLAHQGEPVRAADHAALLKRAVKGVAARHGMIATFMSKPFAELAGNGLHVHLSLLDRDGRNVFDDGTRTGSERLRHAVAGLKATMPAAMAIFAPNANAYRRFQPGSYAPLAPSWGVENRTVALRVIGAPGKDKRIEHRVAGADANPYLALAA